MSHCGELLLIMSVALTDFVEINVVLGLFVPLVNHYTLD